MTVLLLTLVGEYRHLEDSYFLPCEYECGETLIAEFDARNVRLFGPRFGLVEDLATSPSVTAHPQYYTHNVNLGGLSFILMDWLGISSFEGRQTVILVVWGLGLLYAYICVAHFSRSQLCGLVVLVLLATDFPFSHAYSAHALRTWQWLPIFGLPFHVHRYTTTRRPLDILGLAILFAVSFGVGYDFWIIMVAVSLLFVLTSRPGPQQLTYRRLVLDCVVLGLLALCPFVLRQVHIAVVLGWEYWQFDFLTTVRIKIPFLNALAGELDMAAVQEWYVAHNVMRPPAAPITPERFQVFVNTLRNALVHVTLPSAGPITMLITVVAAVGGVVDLLRRGLRRSEVPSDSKTVAARPAIAVARLTRFIASMTIGIFVGMLVTPSVAILYVLYNPPLIVAPLFAAKALVISLVVSGLYTTILRRRYLMASALAAGLTVVAVDHVLISVDARARSRAMDVSWIPLVRSMPEDTFATSYIAQAVAAFTTNWAVEVGGTGLADRYFRALEGGKHPFTKADLMFFGERDNTVDFTRPDYWLYFPVDRRIHMFDPEPECYSDYITALARQVWMTLSAPSYESALTAQPERVKPGSAVRLTGRLTAPFEQVRGTTVVIGENPPQKLLNNCIAGTLDGVYTIPESTPDGPLPFSVLMTRPDGSRLTLRSGSINVDSAATPSTFSPPQVRQPSIADVLQTYRNLKVVTVREPTAAHNGYLLIDVRGLQP